MKSRLTPYYIELISDACLKSYWRRKALAKFLRQCGVADSFLAAWPEEETKRELLDRLFPKLLEADRGRQALVRMADYLAERKTFPDLQGWEDSVDKIAAANLAVERLRAYHFQQREQLVTEAEKTKAREEFAKRQSEISESQQSLQRLSERLNQLARRLGEQGAGYDFQDWFHDFLKFFEIPSRKPYVHDGRQIDGSLTLSGTTYLVELKFTADQAPATDIDTFYKKVVTKADNTMGVMISISGYSSVAVREASGQRTPILLFDFNHLYLALGGTMSFGEIVERVRRHASQTGEAYLSVNGFNTAADTNRGV